MLRRALLAALIGLAAHAWVASARSAASARDHAGHAVSVQSIACDASTDADDAERRWTARIHTTAALTQSAWRTQLLQAETGGAPADDSLRDSSRPAARSRGAPHTPPHLRSIPLLI